MSTSTPRDVAEFLKVTRPAARPDEGDDDDIALHAPSDIRRPPVQISAETDAVLRAYLGPKAP